MNRRHPEPVDISEQILQAVDAYTHLIELVAGYRARCEQQGFSQTAAEAMAVDYHRVLWGGYVAGLPR